MVAESESDRGGEIDLIVADRKKRSLIFVEVKTLQTTRPDTPPSASTRTSRRESPRAALRFLKRRDLLGTPCRFDVVAVWWPKGES